MPPMGLPTRGSWRSRRWGCKVGQVPIVVINGRSIPGSRLFSRSVIIAWLPLDSGFVEDLFRSLRDEEGRGMLARGARGEKLIFIL